MFRALGAKGAGGSKVCRAKAVIVRDIRAEFVSCCIHALQHERIRPQQQQIVSFAEAKVRCGAVLQTFWLTRTDSDACSYVIPFQQARDLHAMAIDVFTSLEKQCAGGGQLNKETFGNWCEGAKTLRAEADGFGSLSIPITCVA